MQFILWFDCDAEGESIAGDVYEICLDACRKTWPQEEDFFIQRAQCSYRTRRFVFVLCIKVYSFYTLFSATLYTCLFDRVVLFITDEIREERQKCTLVTILEQKDFSKHYLYSFISMNMMITNIVSK
jgi:hypothetical protein